MEYAYQSIGVRMFLSSVHIGVHFTKNKYNAIKKAYQKFDRLFFMFILRLLLIMEYIYYRILD